MSQSIRFDFRSLPERIRAGLGRRVAAIFLTLLIEGLLVFLLLTLAPSIVRHKDSSIAVFSIGSEPETASVSEQVRAPSEHPARDPRQDARPATQPPEPEQPAPLPLPLIPLSRAQMAAADIDAMRALPAPPAAARRSMIGPTGAATPGDTQRVDGQGPNGEPLYAAAWYREPYDDELRGYLSTARGPGWGLIACRTVPDYRVEDCVALGESPEGSNITRAVLAAAWQFRVRPPRLGGRSKIGEWVRIRIDYTQRRQ